MEEVKKTKVEFEEETLEYQPDVLPTTDIDSQIDEFQYGLSVPKLKIGDNTNEASSGYKVKTLIFDRSSTVGTGTQDFTGFGFTPTSYQTRFNYKGQSGAFLPMLGWGAYDGTSSYNTRIQGTESSSNGPSGTSNNVIRLQEGANNTTAAHSAFLTDGVRLNFTGSAHNIILEITCFG